MFERFTDKARKVIILAKTKATDRGDDQIGPVHMLYGLAAADGVAARALASLGVDAAAVERELGRASSAGGRVTWPAAPVRRAGRGRRGAGGDRHRPGRDPAADRGELRPRSA